MENIQLRKVAKESGIKLWEIASKLRMTDGNFSRMLRHKLTDADKDKIIEIIEELKEEKSNEKQFAKTVKMPKSLKLGGEN